MGAGTSRGTSRGKPEQKVNRKLPEQIRQWRFALFFLISMLLFFCLFILRWNYLDVSQMFPPNDLPCLSFLSDGTLYGDQPFCTQGPPYYLLIGILRALSPDHFLLLVTLLSMAVSAALITSVCWILQKETGKPRFLSSVLLYSLIIYYPSGSIHRGLPILLSTLFFLLGYIYLRHRHQYWLAGALLGLALVTKATIGTAVLLLVGWQLIQKGAIIIKKQPFSIQVSHAYTKWKSLLAIAASGAAVFLLLYFWFPGFPGHTIYSGTQSTVPMSFGSALITVLYRNIAFLTPFNYTLYAILLLGAAGFAFRRTLAGFIGLFGGAISFVILSRNLAFVAADRFLIPYLLLIFIGTAALWDALTEKRHIMRVMLLTAILFPGLVLVGMDIGKYHVRHLVEEPIRQLPVQQGKILTSGWTEEYSRNLFRSISYEVEDFDLYRPRLTIDQTQAAGYQAFGIVSNLAGWENLLDQGYSAQLDSFSRRFNDSDYSMVFTVPPHQTDIAGDMIMRFENGTSYCVTYIPYLYSFNVNPSGRAGIFMFMDPADCITVIGTVAEYYETKYQDICAWTPSYAGYIKEFLLSLNGITLNEECLEDGSFDFLELYDYTSRMFSVSSDRESRGTEILWTESVAANDTDGPQSIKDSSKEPSE